MITQKELKKIFYYDSDTGLFIRLVSTSNAVKVGDVVGSIRADGYLTIQINNKAYKAHRLAWLYHYGFFPENDIDHINHNRADNRIKNLRDVPESINCKNICIKESNKSEFVGVHFVSKLNKWKAGITVDGKKIYLGIYTDIKDAIQKRIEANEKYGFHSNHGKIYRSY